MIPSEPGQARARTESWRRLAKITAIALGIATLGSAGVAGALAQDGGEHWPVPPTSGIFGDDWPFPSGGSGIFGDDWPFPGGGSGSSGGNINVGGNSGGSVIMGGGSGGGITIGGGSSGSGGGGGSGSGGGVYGR